MPLLSMRLYLASTVVGTLIGAILLVAAWWWWMGTIHACAWLGLTKCVATQVAQDHFARDWRDRQASAAPLHYAARAGHLDVAAVLLAANAAVDARDGMNMTPLHWAARSNESQMAVYLLKQGARPNPQSEASYSTPLHLAAKHGYRAVVTALLAGGADPCIRDRTGKPPVHYTIDPEVKRTLLSAMHCSSTPNASER